MLTSMYFLKGDVMLTFINKSPTIKSFTILFFEAFIIRTATFQFFIKPEYRYIKQIVFIIIQGTLHVVKLWHEHSISRRIKPIFCVLPGHPYFYYSV